MHHQVTPGAYEASALRPRTRLGERPSRLSTRSVAEIVLDDESYNLFWQITTPGIHGVDLLFLSPDESALALEVNGTLRRGAISRLTPSRLRRMSREWLNDPANPAMAAVTSRALPATGRSRG